jgi:hypothetical protein
MDGLVVFYYSYIIDVLIGQNNLSFPESSPIGRTLSEITREIQTVVRGNSAKASKGNLTLRQKVEKVTSRSVSREIIHRLHAFIVKATDVMVSI